MTQELCGFRRKHAWDARCRVHMRGPGMLACRAEPSPVAHGCAEICAAGHVHTELVCRRPQNRWHPPGFGSSKGVISSKHITSPGQPYMVGAGIPGFGLLPVCGKE